MTDVEHCTALVVDDDNTKRYIIGSWLQRAGHTVVYAMNAAETFQRLAEHDVNLVVLDVKLPDMSGVEVCARIKAEPETASMPVIHISAWAVDVTDRTHGLQRGADAYLTDPIDPDEFIATVEAVMRYYRARVRAERMAGQLSAFTRTSLAINAAETFEQLTTVAARGAYDIFREPASVLVLAPDGRPRRAVSLNGEPEQRASPPAVFDQLIGLMDLGDAPDTTVALVSARQWKSVLPDAVAHGDVAVVMSRSKRGRPPICIGIEARGEPDEVDLNILRQLGQAMALAMEALRSFAEQHFISLTLQRSLLPSEHPTAPGWTFSVRYEPASDQAEVGGDFYEVIDRGDHMLVAIGDVQGHSLHAATVMAEIRHALRAFAEEGHDAVTILKLLNGVMLRYHDDQTVTMCLMTLDVHTGALQVANAGHLPPLYLADGEARYGKGGGVLLGFPADGVAIEETEVPPGGTVVLITDGLIEDRGIPLSTNLERLRTIATPVDDDLERFSDRLLAEFGHREDDVALVALRRAP
ncbi:fused response regulator/phosphatase [Actinomadura sp. 7K534]|uniref:fused response regulator/phosphatase n=1 Tax=Actinomadura sp. 7K534 TaxID=2530366 RepID=UPI001042A468|nr:fused response regulator/phosphatase [Actinomadura sp. 7K534]TDB90288.1 fused response regulator/phosphatase [Actinomadura sp. 7K534]